MSQSLEEPSVLTQGNSVNFAVSQIIWGKGALVLMVLLSFRPQCLRDDTILYEPGICCAVDILVLGVMGFNSSTLTYP